MQKKSLYRSAKIDISKLSFVTLSKGKKLSLNITSITKLNQIIVFFNVQQIYRLQHSNQCIQVEFPAFCEFLSLSSCHSDNVVPVLFVMSQHYKVLYVFYCSLSRVIDNLFMSSFSFTYSSHICRQNFPMIGINHLYKYMNQLN